MTLVESRPSGVWRGGPTRRFIWFIQAVTDLNDSTGERFYRPGVTADFQPLSTSADYAALNRLLDEWRPVLC